MQLSHESLIKAYRSMATIRQFEERVQEEFSKGNIPGFVHLSVGQEASAVGVCSHLGPGDHIASTHRGHGHSIAKGCDVTGIDQYRSLFLYLIVLNAGVVGLLLAALYHPVWTSAIHAPSDFALALAAFGLLTLWRVPPWLVVAFAAAGGSAMAAFH